MPEQNPQNQPGGSERNPDPKIRTMKSDIDEYMREAKPSLIQIVTKQVETTPRPLEPERAPFPIKNLMVIMAGILILGAAGLLGYRYFTTRPLETIQVEIEEKIPGSIISTEKTEVHNITPNLGGLQKAIYGAADITERTGSFKRLVIKIKTADGKSRLMSASDLYDTLSIRPPAQLRDSVSGSLFVYVYYSGAGPRAVLIAPSKNTSRTFAGMVDWENAMQRDLEILFLGKSVNPVIAPFIDKTFKNIDYRYINIASELGIGYFIFTARDYLVVTTSEEALQLVINRLFEAS